MIYVIRLELDRKAKKIRVADPSDVTSLQKGFYGQMDKGIITLSIEEALYIMDIRNGKCYDEAGNEHTFNDLVLFFIKQKKILARYLTYKDWRDKGLILRDSGEATGNYGRSGAKKYTKSKFRLDGYSYEGVFFPGDIQCVLDDEVIGRELYERHWIGQFGTYKSSHRGKITKLDIYETIYLMRHGGLKLKNSDETQVLREADSRIKYFDDMYSVYEDWRKRGYIIKTGFKFGTHFRIYFPGASPVKTEKDWVHSKHVIHVFSRRSKMIISEWARAIRVAHSVKKTFILAIPGKSAKVKKKKKRLLDFLLYHRKNGGIETPKDGKPKYLMLSLTEDEYIGGEELADALEECKGYGLEMIMAISDRESSVTDYMIKRVELPGSEYDYFEIEWIQP